jgi:hypothetical protein
MNCGNKNTNCQCDGNCECGVVLPNGKISCHNCGWKAPMAYNTLSGNFVCPTCRTESSYNNQNKIEKMNNNNGNFSQGLVGLGAVNAGFLNWSTNPLGANNGSNESGFASGNQIVGFAAGQGYAVMDLAPRSAEDQMYLNIFNQQTGGNNEESGALGDNLRSSFVRFTPYGWVIRDSFCGKYCKALGYMRSADKNAFKRCKAACKVNFVDAKKGKWKYPAAPEGIESSVSPEELAIQATKEATSMPDSQKNQIIADAQKEMGAEQPKSNTLTYVIIGAVVLIAIIIAVVIMMRKRANA